MGGFEQILVHTGQHYDARCPTSSSRSSASPSRTSNLSVGSGTHAEQTARAMQAFEPVLLEYAPDASSSSAT